ncbi:MAG: glycosyltransferase family 9 protein [Ktedonobacteraceae bacterium]
MIDVQGQDDRKDQGSRKDSPYYTRALQGDSSYSRGDPYTRPDPWRSPCEEEEPRKIAIFRALYMGDLLLAVPALRAIRARFPRAEITLIGLPWAATFARRFSSYIDRFVEFVGHPGITEVEIEPEREQRFLAEQRAYGYDLVIQMHGSGRTSNPFTLALNGRMTVAYYEGTPTRGLTLGLPYPQDMPEVERNLGLAKLLGCSELDPRLEFPLLPADRVEAAKLLLKLPRGRPRIGLHAGAKAPARRWPAAYFARVADYLVQHFNAQIILTGSTHEAATIRSVVEHMRTRPYNLAGQTSFGGLAGLINELDLFISNDTGPAHIANALDTPGVTIFGPVDPRRWASADQARHPFVRRAVPCSPCAHWECPIDHRCLRWISPDEVIKVARQLLVKGNVACSA